MSVNKYRRDLGFVPQMCATPMGIRQCRSHFGPQMRRRLADQHGYAGHISDSLTVDLRLFQGNVQPRKVMNLTGRRHVLSASQFPEKTTLDPDP